MTARRGREPTGRVKPHRSELEQELANLRSVLKNQETRMASVNALLDLVNMTGAAYQGIKMALAESKRETEAVRSQLMQANYRITSLETQSQKLAGRLL